MTIEEKILLASEQHREEFLALFRHFHRHPEVSLKEYETTAYIRGKLFDLGYRILDLGTETGVVAELDGPVPGPCVALRVDMDALPIQEKSTCPFPSLRDGVMHACGHDTHISSLLSAAILLSEFREDIIGKVRLIFQPAEEINIGAQEMIKAGCLEGVSCCFSFHNSPEIPTGTVAVLRGPIMAGLNTIDICITGKGGHGGIPQRNTDPVVAAAAVIQALQTIVSRNVAPTNAAVVSICSVHTENGMISNVIPDSVRMKGTVRFYSYKDKELINRRIQEITDNITEAFGCSSSFETSEDLPITSNEAIPGMPDIYDLARKAAVGAGTEIVTPDPSGGGDDFSHYRLGVFGHPGVPSFFYWLGVRNEEKDCVYSWHSPEYQADPDAIPIGARLFALSALYAGKEFRDGTVPIADSEE